VVAAIAVVDHLAGHRDQVRQLFDAKAATWSAKYAPDGPLTGRLTSLAGALSSHVPAEGRVLDVGCGTGELAQAAANGGLLVTACDISPEMLRGAADRDTDGLVDWVLLDANWRALPFEPATFDAVVASSVLEYVHDPAAVLAECARVLRPGGIVLCTVPSISHPVRRLEGLIRAAARGPVVRALSRDRPRLTGYLTYLRISRQRHPARWWRAAAAQADLRTVQGPADSADRSTLRLFVFQRPDDSGEGA
jgi:SAM-dependent methyltransferase